MLYRCFHWSPFRYGKTARFQNNLNLRSVTQCLDYNHRSPFDKSLDICARNLRSMGITGDIFVIRKDDRSVLWDESQDARTTDPTKIFMNEGGMCTLFTKPQTCLDAVEKMVNTPYGEVEWQFYYYINTQNTLKQDNKWESLKFTSMKLNTREI